VSILHTSQLPTSDHSLSRQLCVSLSSVSFTSRKTYTKGSGRSSNDAVYCVGHTQTKEASVVNESVTLCWQYSNYIAQFKLYSVSHVCVCVCVHIYIKTHLHHPLALFTLHSHFHAIRGKICKKDGAKIWDNYMSKYGIFQHERSQSNQYTRCKFNECR
jgi:hypothetical protein